MLSEADWLTTSAAGLTSGIRGARELFVSKPQADVPSYMPPGEEAGTPASPSFVKIVIAREACLAHAPWT